MDLLAKGDFRARVYISHAGVSASKRRIACLPNACDQAACIAPKIHPDQRKVAVSSPTCTSLPIGHYASAGHADYASEGITVTAFLIEDSETIRANLISALEDLAQIHVIAYAETEREAVTWLSAHDGWTLAIVDLFLKEGSGLGVLTALRHRHASQRVVVFSNYPVRSIRERCLAMGADRVFDKSTEIDEFLAYCASADPS